jgi:exosortase
LLNSSVWILLFSGIIAHLTLLTRHFGWMWRLEHFQYFPVALAAAAVVAHDRRFDIVRRATGPKTSLVYAGLLAMVGFLCLGLLLGFPLVGWLSILGFLAVLLYASYGWGGLAAAWPIFLMLLLTRPLPDQLVQPITIGMQKIASQLASGLLDMFGVMHVQQGVVLSLVGKSFMAEEACSGIRSLFSSIAAIVFFGLMQRYGWRRHTFNILQTIFWVIIFNAVRIAAVILVEDRWEFSIAEGWRHELFGYLIFFLIFGTILSTDQWIAAIFPPVEAEPPAVPAHSPTQWYNALSWPGSRWSVLAFSLAYGLLGLLSLRLLSLQPVRTGFIEPLVAASRDQLPPEMLGWKVKNFRHLVRDRDDLQGKESYVWEFEKQGLSAVLSLDGTFDDYHYLAWCYSARGWECGVTNNYTSVVERAAGKTSGEEELTELALTKSSGETGLVLFTAVDKYGEVVVPPLKLQERSVAKLIAMLVNAVKFAFGQPSVQQVRLATFVPPVSTVQLLVIPPEPLNEAGEQEVKRLFLTSRDLLRRSTLFEREAVGVASREVIP